MFKKLLVVSIISIGVGITACDDSPLGLDQNFQGQEIELEGRISTVDFEDHLFTLQQKTNVIIIFNPFTCFELEDEDPCFDSRVLRPGLEVEVEGIIFDENTVLAIEVEIED